MNKDFISRVLSIFPLAIVLGALMHFLLPELYMEMGEEPLVGIVFWDVFIEVVFLGLLVVFYAEFVGFFIRILFFKKVDMEKDNSVTINVAGVNNGQDSNKPPPLAGNS